MWLSSSGRRQTCTLALVHGGKNEEENLHGGDGCADGVCRTYSKSTSSSSMIKFLAGSLGPPGMRRTTVEMTRGRCSPSFGH